MLAGTEARGMPGVKVKCVRFQGVDQGYTMDDLILEGTSPGGNALLEIQSKRDITFSPKDGTFAEVATQVARSPVREVSEERHLLAVATQRQSKSLSGPYQDVLLWARAAKTSREFFDRVAAKGVASDPMRTFVATFRFNLVVAGVADDDHAIWKLLRRFAILVFDFESTAPLARLHTLALARQVLADEDVARAESLWSGLIEISIAIGKVGGGINREELRAKLLERGYRLAGDRDYRQARARLADLARMTLAGIGTRVAGVSLSRHGAVTDLNAALDEHRFVELRGGPGVGKSAVLRVVAERVGREAQLIVLDSVSTPARGWLSFAQALAVPGTAREFLDDLAVSGGALIVIDGLEMFTDPARQRTVNELLREAGAVPGFTVIATCRSADETFTDRWIADDVLDAFGGSHPVVVGELTDEEVEFLSGKTPELRAILAPSHPAASIARNLYRLSRLLKAPASAKIRTEAALASQWWASADNAPTDVVRAGQRILAELAQTSLTGGNVLKLGEDSAARLHLTGSLSLTEVRRDQFTYYHDVLRDWGIGNLIHEDHTMLSNIDLSVRASPRVARGIEIAARLALEEGVDCTRWLSLLDRLSPVGAHSSWRRQGLLAIVHSEIGPELLERCAKALLARGGALFAELTRTIAAVETISTADLFASMQVVTDKPVLKSLRTNTTGTGIWLLRWVLAHSNELPLQAIGTVVDLVKVQIQLLVALPRLASPTATMMFNWLRQLDVRGGEVTFPTDSTVERMDSYVRRHMVEDLRAVALLLSEQSPHDAKAYLREVDAWRDTYKVKAIRRFSTTLASAAPAELAELIASSLIEKHHRNSTYEVRGGRAFGHADSDYLPASPAQPPFLELLLASPEDGLALVRRLVSTAIEFHSRGAEAGENGFTVVFDDGPRFFPWSQTYFWSRDQAQEYSAASGLKALEAWGHHRLDAGEPVDVVLADILGPTGSCAAYLLVAVDILISHFPVTRSALVPFLASPELLAIERYRGGHDQMNSSGRLAIGDEPSGRVSLADLREKPSRRATLENLLPAYLSNDPASETLRDRLRNAVGGLELYAEHAGFGDPSFMGRYAQNVVNPENWVEVEGERAYRSPPEEMAHLERLGARRDRFTRESEMEARIQLAIDESEQATPATARDAVEHADGDLPDDSDTDALKSRSTRLITTAMLVARDGDDELLDAHEGWVREVIRRALAEETNRYSGSNDLLRFNRPALGALALLHLWRRRGVNSDRDALVSIAARRDCGSLPAFAAALRMIADKDPRLLKASMRAAFAGYVRRRPHDENEAVQKRFEEERNAALQSAIAAEIAWLDGAEEPAWPAFPTEKPILRAPLRIRVPKRNEVDLDDEAFKEVADSKEMMHADSNSAAQWLRLLNEGNGKSVNWGDEIVRSYSDWSARLNGARLPAEAQMDRSLSEWNTQFYALYAEELMIALDEDLEAMMEQITSLPDQSFANVAETLLHAADVLYFNDATRAPKRPVELRVRMASRTMALRRWRGHYSPGDLSIDFDTSRVVAKMLLNTHDPFQGTRSYLVPAVADKLDPLLEPMRQLQASGPTAFVAFCTMNMLLVAPRARHLDFTLAAVEAWFERLSADAGIWTTMGIGRKVVEWFQAALIEEPSLLEPAHPERDRIDRVLGWLVAVGVAEAHDIETRIESAAITVSHG